MKTKTSIFTLTLVILFALFLVSTQTQTLAIAPPPPCPANDIDCHNSRRNPPPPPPPPAWNENITYGSLTDTRDNQTYRTVEMPDGKTWMAQNLNFETEAESWCHPYGCGYYGRFYDWETAVTVCPAGWRLPNDNDWRALIHAVGHLNIEKLRSQSGWWDGGRADVNGNGTDEFGFRALPGGSRYPHAHLDTDYSGIWWSATEHDSNQARILIISGAPNDLNVSHYRNPKGAGLSVRCIKDERR